MSLLSTLLFGVQFPFHYTGSTSLYVLHKDNSQGTTVRRHLYMGQREGGRKMKARMKRKIQRKQFSCYWKGQEQRKLLFFSHMLCGEYASCSSWWSSEFFKCVTENCDLWYKAE